MAAILAFPIDLIRIFNESISLFRIFLILALISTSLFILEQMKIPNINRIAVSWIIIGFSSSILAFLFSLDNSYAKSALLNDLSGIMLVFTVLMNYSVDDIDVLLKAFVLSQLSAIPFSIYTIRLFGNMASIFNNITFLGIFTLKLDYSQTIETIQNLRLFLPYSSATALSVTMAASIVVLIYKGNYLFGRILKSILLILYSALMVFSQSRTGIVALFIVILVYTIIRSFKTRSFKLASRFVVVFLVLVAISSFIIRTSNSAIIEKFVKRIKYELAQSIFDNRHFLVPLEGLRIWLSSPSSFIFGIGYGGNAHFIGKWTYLPDNSFLNSFVTVVAQKGLLGLFMIFLWIILYNKTVRYSKAIGSYHLTILWAVLLVSCLFYELYQTSTFWTVLAITLLASQEKFERA
ncbi:MAG: O-antigen ligase family protein [Rectinema sp.]